MIVSEILIVGVGVEVGSSPTITGLAPFRIMYPTRFSFLSSISALSTNEYFSRLKIRFTKL